MPVWPIATGSLSLQFLTFGHAVRGTHKNPSTILNEATGLLNEALDELREYHDLMCNSELSELWNGYKIYREAVSMHVKTWEAAPENPWRHPKGYYMNVKHAKLQRRQCRTLRNAVKAASNQVKETPIDEKVELIRQAEDAARDEGNCRHDQPRGASEDPFRDQPRMFVRSFTL